MDHDYALKYREEDGPFFRELRSRVRRHLRDHGHTRFAGPRMVLKTITILTMFLGSYALILTNHFHGLGLFAALLVMHFFMFMTTVGIAHDAAHRCYSRHSWLNSMIVLLFDCLGVNSDYWIKNHVHSHHAAPNVPLLDSAIESFSVMRLHPKSTRSRVSPYQHWYMFGIYSLATLFQCYVLEFLSFRQNLIGFRKGDAHSRRRIAAVYLSKGFMIGWSLVLPLWLIDAPVWIILSGCLVGHLMCGLLIGIIFMTTHLADDTTFPEPDEHGYLPGSFSTHIVATTADFSASNPIVTWIAGGLNLHVAHHLFPQISQIHLPAMTRILKQTAKDFGVPYRENSLVDALAGHLRLLKRLGSAPAWPSPSR